MRYGIFKRTVTTIDGVVAISFTSLQNPANPREPARIEEENEQVAASKAGELLRALGVKTHSIHGCPELIMEEFPNYFVGRFADDLADRYDTSRLVNEISTFTPIPRV